MTAPSPRSYRVKIPEQMAGERLDKAIAALCDGVSRTLARKLLGVGAVRVDGLRCRRVSAQVEAGAWLELTVDPGALAADVSSGVDVVKQGGGWVVVAKRPGQHVQGTAGGDEGTVLRALERRSDRGSAPLLVHRLDAPASGLVLVATRRDIAAALSEQLRARTVVRSYVALVDGIPEHGSGTIELPLRKVARGLMAVDPTGMEARTRFAVVATYPSLGRSLLRATLDTGRMHQIRVHLAHAVASIVGDRRYGRASAGARLRLHAERLRFRDPSTGKPVEVTLPPDPGFWDGLD